jgi:uncharacterized membrane protein YgdD (TMEM256/DUF423 family)
VGRGYLTVDRVFFALGAVSALVAVAAGAFGAHTLRNRLVPDMLGVFEVGARYHMYHALALLAVAWAVGRWPGGVTVTAGWLFVAGTLIFSGSSAPSPRSAASRSSWAGPRWPGPRFAAPDPPTPVTPADCYSFNAPATSPRTSQRWSPTTMTIGGRLARIDAAAMSPHGTSKTPGKSASATGTVRLASVAVNV